MRKTVKHQCALLALLSVLAVLLLPVTAMAAEANSAKTLKDAIAGNDATITLTGSFTLGEKITVNRDVTIQGNHTITRADSYTGTLFEVAAGAELTLKDLTIDGNNNWSFNESEYNAALNDATVKSDDGSYYTPASGSPVATQDMIIVKGALNTDGITIQNHAGNSSCRVMNAAANSVIMLKNTEIKHCATVHESTVVIISSGAVVTVSEGTVISDIYGCRNGIVSRVNGGKLIVESDAVIEDCKGVNSNGSVAMLYNNAVMEMKGGSIRNNSNVRGPNNGNGSVVYIHTGSQFIMTDGTISGNKGIANAGVLMLQAGNKVSISGGKFLNNEALKDKYASVPDLLHARDSDIKDFVVTGGTFGQDVTPYIPEGKHLYAFDNGDGTWTVKEGTKITYKLNGGTAEGNPEVYPLNESLTLKDPVREGFIFKGWTGANGTVPQKNLTITLNVYEAEFTANWEEELTTLPAGPGEPQPPVSGLPKTGDNSSLMLFVLMMAASMAGMLLMRKACAAKK